MLKTSGNDLILSYLILSYLILSYLILSLPEIAAGQLGPWSVYPGGRHAFDYLHAQSTTIKGLSMRNSIRFLFYFLLMNLNSQCFAVLLISLLLKGTVS